MGTQTHLGDLTHRLIKAEGSLSYACRSLYACSMLTVLRLQSASLQRLSFPWAVPTWAKVWARCVSTCTLYYLTTGISTLSFPETSVKLIFSTPTIAKVLSERLANEANEGRKSRPMTSPRFGYTEFTTIFKSQENAASSGLRIWGPKGNGSSQLFKYGPYLLTQLAR